MFYNRQFLHPKSQAGQAIVLLTLMMIVLLGAVGFAIDGGQSYYYSSKIEISAGAAAMAGVVYMPSQFSSAQASPSGSQNDAQDAAIAAAYQNGLQNGVGGVSVTSAVVANHPNRLSVTVTKTFGTFFMQIFGIKTISVSRTAVAVYQPPISLGQSGTQMGSTITHLGTPSSNNFYFMREEGWAVDRTQGDAYTPDPSTQSSNDVHVISNQAGTDTGAGVSGLPAAGGYNYLVTLPAGGGYIQVYNAIFGPDDGSGSHGFNNCENHITPSNGSNKFDQCNVNGSSYYFHEEDSISNFSDKTQYGAMEYTILGVSNTFVRSSDTKVSQVIVYPINASGFDNTNVTGCGNNCVINNAYTNMKTGATINQKYDSAGKPTNMLTYHSWVDISGGAYTGANDNLTFKVVTAPSVGSNDGNGNWLLPAGTYRLRVDSLNYDGSLPPGSSLAHKGYDVRVAGPASNSTCTGCSVSSMSDMATYTPMNLANGGTFQMSLFQLSPDYAGQTIGVDIYDIGDMGGTGSIYVGFIDPSTNALLVEPSGGASASAYDAGSQRSNYPGSASLLSTFTYPTQVEQIVTQGGTTLAGGKWYHFNIPIPATYNPGSNSANWWWKLQYRTTVNVTADDTVTFAAGLQGDPVHLLTS